MARLTSSPEAPAMDPTSRRTHPLTGNPQVRNTECLQSSEWLTRRLARLSHLPSPLSTSPRLRVSPYPLSPALAQVPLSSIPAELWALAAAVVGSLTWLAKRFLFRRHRKPTPEYISRAEFHQELDLTRDRISATYLALADKIELQHNQVFTELERQGASFEKRLDRLDTTVARLDERTTQNHR